MNRQLKRAYGEAAHADSIRRRRYPSRPVIQLYGRVLRRKGHQKTVGAVARHFAEASYWVLKKGQPC